MVQELTTPSAKAVGHTALPWQAEEHPNPGFGLDITTADETICQHIENPANAAFIVRAANSHYQLLSALKEILRHDISDVSPSAEWARDRAEEIVAQAEEGL